MAEFCVHAVYLATWISQVCLNEDRGKRCLNSRCTLRYSHTTNIVIFLAGDGGTAVPSRLKLSDFSSGIAGNDVRKKRCSSPWIFALKTAFSKIYRPICCGGSKNCCQDSFWNVWNNWTPDIFWTNFSLEPEPRYRKKVAETLAHGGS